MLLTRVGYWRPLQSRCRGSADDAALPDPRELVDATLRPDLKRQIVNYLKNGRIWGHCLGYSYCRFQCGTPNSVLGSNDLTDGTWVWPEGLWHYVEVHSVQLPPQFMEHLKQRDFRQLTDTEFLDLGELDDGRPCHTAAELYELLRLGR